MPLDCSQIIPPYILNVRTEGPNTGANVLKRQYVTPATELATELHFLGLSARGLVAIPTELLWLTLTYIKMVKCLYWYKI